MKSLPNLAETALQLVAPGKGILAADESTPTIAKRFASIHVESTEDRRRAYRGLLFSAPGVDEFISGVILYDETLRQSSADGTPFPALLDRRGILPGIKVDSGAKALAGAAGEKVTEGLDGLRERLEQYRELGARFAKWRAVITIDESTGLPSDYCLDANAHALARYAALCIEQGLVPIVEPEVLMDGEHGIDVCFEVTERCLRKVFACLYEHRVDLREILLKPNMVVPGQACAEQASVEQVAASTIACFRRAVPAEVPGIVFLSGGQSETEATAHLDAMNRLGSAPWQLSFSYGRALQASALAAWGGQGANVEAAQQTFHERARLNGAARFGRYSPELESPTAS
jgi:fructose-bisphosphate aldolase class I